MNNQRLIFSGGFQFIVGLDLPAVSAIFQRPLRFTHVGIADGGAHRVQRHALVKQRLRVEVDAHRGQRAAAHDIDITNTVDLRNRRSQLRRGEIVQFTLRISIGG